MASASFLGKRLSVGVHPLRSHIVIGHGRIRAGSTNNVILANSTTTGSAHNRILTINGNHVLRGNRIGPLSIGINSVIVFGSNCNIGSRGVSGRRILVVSRDSVLTVIRTWSTRSARRAGLEGGSGNDWEHGVQWQHSYRGTTQHGHANEYDRDCPQSREPWHDSKWVFQYASRRRE